MYDVVHIDEKWFYMIKKSANYYLLVDEDEPYHTPNNKNYLGKVMFLVAVARPRFDDEGKEIFLEKIGVFPLVQQVASKRSSVNTPSSTLETKLIASITKEFTRWFYINKVLPPIKQIWPQEHTTETIYIQQDNEEFCRAAFEGGFDIRLICQPPNFPYLNDLDLCFFSIVQSLEQQEVNFCKTSIS